MKLYDTPELITELEKDDIVYAVVNDEITEARVVDYVYNYIISQSSITVTRNSYIKVETANGHLITTGPDLRNIDFYNSVDDLIYNQHRLAWWSGHVNLYKEGNEQNIKELVDFINAIENQYGIKQEGSEFVFHTIYKNQVVDILSDKVIEKCGSEISFSDNNGDMQTLSELKAKKIFPSIKECVEDYDFKIVKFDDEKK